MEFAVPCWRRHSDSSLSPFLHPPGASLIFSFNLAAARHGGAAVVDRGGGGGGRRRRLCMPLAAGRRRDDAIGQGVPFTLLGGTCRGAFRSGSGALFVLNYSCAVILGVGTRTNYKVPPHPCSSWHLSWCIYSLLLEQTALLIRLHCLVKKMTHATTSVSLPAGLPKPTYLRAFICTRPGSGARSDNQHQHTRNFVFHFSRIDLYYSS